MTCRERTPVEDLNVGDVVQAVQNGPRGTVVDADCHGRTLVQYLPTSRTPMSYWHGIDRLYVVMPSSDERPRVDAFTEELVLRLVDAADVLASVKTSAGWDLAAVEDRSVLVALDYALRGDRGLETPSEFEERRRQALARHGTYLGLSDPK